MARAETLERYFRVPADDRDLNYDKYFVEGETTVSTFEDYTSHNTTQLSVAEIKSLLTTLPFIKEALHA
jgi:UDP-glucose 4-epimerase